MEENKFANDKEIVYSKAIKAGKRVYFLDVKKTRNDELFLSITESIRKISGDEQDGQVTFDKHKIRLYKEDFEKFRDGLNDVLDYIESEQEC